MPCKARSRRNPLGDENLDNICVSFLAGTQPDFFSTTNVDKLMKTGFTARTIYLHAELPRFYRSVQDPNAEQLEQKMEILKYLKKLKYVAGQVKLSPEAQAFHKEIYESGSLNNCRINKERKLENYYGRKNVHLLKLSMAVHFAESTTMVVELEDMKKALKLLEAAEVDMHKIFTTTARNPVFEACHDILYMLSEGPLSQRKVDFRLARDYSKEERADAIDYTIATGRVIRRDDLLIKNPDYKD